MSKKEKLEIVKGYLENIKDHFSECIKLCGVALSELETAEANEETELLKETFMDLDLMIHAIILP